MDAKDNLDKIEHTMAPTKTVPKVTPDVAPYAQHVRFVFLSGTKGDSLALSRLRGAFTTLQVRTREGREMRKQKGKQGAGVDREAVHERTDDEHFAEMPFESDAGATGHPTHPATSPLTATTLYVGHPATSSPTATTLEATHQATATSRVAEDAALTAAPYLPMEWTQGVPLHQWHLQSTNQLSLVLLTLLSMSCLPVIIRVPLQGVLEAARPPTMSF